MVSLKSHGILALRAMPQSKMRAAFKHPIPTSLIGAFAYSLFNRERYEVLFEKSGKIRSRADELRKILVSVAVCSIGGSILYGPMFRINRLYKKRVESAITSLPLSINYGEVDNQYRVVYIFDEERLETYSIRDLERAAWGITRLGSRESVVSVEEVMSSSAKLINTTSTNTRFSFPLDKVKRVEGRYDVEIVVDWKVCEIGDYSRTSKIRLAYPLEKVAVEGDLDIIRVDGEEVVIL
ncbi:MAG: type I-A CRISPR-associated protein Cas5a [Nitrososphaerota archaeon]|nr:type I-A CRISPR-associated protein Cas5a [Nitrososphaerota archaeon]